MDIVVLEFILFICLGKNLATALKPNAGVPLPQYEENMRHVAKTDFALPLRKSNWRAGAGTLTT